MSIERNRRRVPIATEAYSERLRPLMIDHATNSIQLTNFRRSEQGDDLSADSILDGFGRIHHFRRDEGGRWPDNPLPIEPAARALGLDIPDGIDAYVFQSAGCNWRCWYCYVPFADLTARRGDLVSVERMVDAITDAPRPLMVDLTGGQPDLTPEWPVWLLQELDSRGLDDVYVWSDDNLSTDYFWRYLTRDQITYLGEHKRYGRACCVKGYNAESFSFNTKASASEFEGQFDLLGRLHRETAIDYYLYVTLTTPSIDGLADDMTRFLDRLQDISVSLPLRTVPLQILEWGPVGPRMDDVRAQSIELQNDVVQAWSTEIAQRFGSRPPYQIIAEIPR
jgi:uncharacterized Fe-S cluster-containing radical SAM superfamily protein